MKKIFVVLAVFMFSSSLVFAQKEAKPNENRTVVYTFFINVVPDNFQFPLIGFANYAHGDHNNLQAGFINSTKGKTNGAQFGYVNTSVGGVNGYQGAFINVCGNDLNGVQTGFVNAVASKTNGAQFGFVNIGGNDVDGAQFGFVNASAGKVDGIQTGYVNATADSLDGIQVGFVNVTGKDTDGAQIGFVNRTRKLDGFQCGFVNVADTVESGVPLAFISIVRKGGYRAFGYYADEYTPLNFSFRIGIKNLYTSFNYSVLLNQESISSYGFGVGSILPLSKKFFLNPELSFQNTASDFLSFQSRTVFNFSLGYDVTDNLHISLGPAISRTHTINVVEPIEAFNWFGTGISVNSKIKPGFRIGVNYSIF
ncbi:MAG: hypothetical protein JXR36_07885 [Bacteroidales bacterium]|nr:hypothetical protein [Bacteroidales bacterium]